MSTLETTSPRGPASSSVPAASPSTPRATRFPCFDGLRALAAFAVVLVHTAFYSGLYKRSFLNVYTGRLEVGVSVFFVISGFLLYRPFVVAHLSGNPGPAIVNFLDPPIA